MTATTNGLARILPKFAVIAAMNMGGIASADPIQVTTNTGTTVTLYGFAQLDAAWESQRSAPAPGNLAYFASSGTNKIVQSGEWNFTADNTRFGFNIAGPSDSGKSFKLAGKLELDFYGGGASENNPVPRLRLAYGTVAFPGVGLTLLAGQAWDVISPLAPPTINAGILWLGGNLGVRRPQFRASEIVPISGGKWEIIGAVTRSIGVASPYVAASTDGGHDADIPAFQGRTAISLPLWVEKQSATLGVSGHFGQEDVLRQDTTYKTLNSWSANVDLELPLAEFLSLVGEAQYGANLDAYQGGIGQGITKRTIGGVGSAVNVEGWGGWAALRLKAGSSVSLNIGVGVDSVHASTIADGAATRNVNAFANVAYNLTPNSRVGLELERIQTDYKAARYQELWRVQSAYTYSF